MIRRLGETGVSPYKVDAAAQIFFTKNQANLVAPTIKTEKAVFITAFSVLKNEVSGCEHEEACSATSERQTRVCRSAISR